MKPTMKFRQRWTIKTIPRSHSWIMNDCTQSSIPVLIVEQWFVADDGEGEWLELEIAE